METQTPAEQTPPQAPPQEAPTAKPKKTRKKRVSKSSLAKEIERQMLDNSKDILQKKWIALGKALEAGEKWAVELVARQFEGDRGPGAINIVSNTLNVANADEGQAARSLESIVRKLEAQDQFPKALPIPTEIRRKPEPDLPILDAEEV